MSTESKLKAVYTECVIPLNGGNPIFGENRIIIRVNDQGAGPYLQIRGCNDDGETGHEFFLNSEEEIDEFAVICKAMLMQTWQ